MFEKLKYLYRAASYRYRKDPVEVQYLLQNLKPGDIAVDIGCHKGAYLQWMRKSVGSNGKCYAFEPQPQLFDYLSRISQAFSFDNVVLENKAFSATTSELTMNIPVTGSGTSPGATLNQVDAGQGQWQQVTVATTTLDDYFLARNIQPDLMKIDVEGHEWEVLNSGQELLKSVRPKLLLECENRHLKDRKVEDVFEMLNQLGYHGFFVLKNSILPIGQFDAEVHQKVDEGRFWEDKEYVNNFIFE